MKTVKFPDGTRVSALGQGTWRMGEKKSAYDEEVAALRLGIELGMTLIDTAEMYAEGGAEKVVADAIEGARERVFIVSKAYPHHASRTDLPKACERSLQRLRIEAIDLYLLHWKSNDTPLAETVAAFEELRMAGKVRNWGVSNFDLAATKEVLDLPGGEHCAANQVLYHLGARGIEFDLLPWSEEEGIPIMAYSPVGHGSGLLNHPAIEKIAQRRSATPAQVALAWVLRHPGTIAIPKASQPEHVRANADSLKIELQKEDLAELDRAFPPPKGPQPLATL